MDTQLAIILILVFLSGVTAIVSFYVITVLREFRETLKKANDVIDDAHQVTHSVASPISSVLNIVDSAVKSISTVKSIRSLIHDEDENEQSRK